MKKAKRTKYGMSDKENPEWTVADFARARPLKDVFPDLAAYSRTRARKGEAKKQAMSVRFSPEVIDYFKSKGAGWQTRMDNVLKMFVHAARD